MNILDLQPLITEIIGAVEIKDSDISCDDKTREIIREVSEYAKKTELYKENTEKREKFIKENADAQTADIYMMMLQKIIHAPTTIHMYSNVLLLLPFINDLMENQNSKLGSVYNAK